MCPLPAADRSNPVEAYRSSGSSPGIRRRTRPRPDAPRGIVVLKFGSSLLGGADGFRTAATEVASRVAAGARVVAVCSAQRGVTDALSRAAAQLGERGPEALLTRLLATGECASVALLALAVSALGVDVHALDVAGLGIRTRGRLLDADPVEVDVPSLLALLAERPALVVPGFLGVDPSGEVSLLGRGGSDLTALFLAHALGAAECRLVKDVDGLYPVDPASGAADPFEHATWDDVLRVGGRVVQEKAVRFARHHRRSFRISAPGGTGTWVGEAAEDDR